MPTDGPPPERTPEELNRHNVKIIVRILNAANQIVYEGGHEIEKRWLGEISRDAPELVSCYRDGASSDSGRDVVTSTP